MMMEWFDCATAQLLTHISSAIKAVVNQVISLILFTDSMNKASKTQV